MVSKEVKFFGYILTIYVCFLYWGYVQEKLFSNEYELSKTAEKLHPELAPMARWDYALALNCCMAVMCGVVCIITEHIGSFALKRKIDSVDPSQFIRLSLTCVMASPLSYEALKYISYPLMVLTKSSKPIPVMMIGVFVFQKSYPFWKYVSVGLLVIGIGLFSYLAHQDSEEGARGQPLWVQMFGLVLVFGNLILDGFTNNQQDSVFSRFKVSSLTMMKYTNLWQVLWLCLMLTGKHFYSCLLMNKPLVGIESILSGTSELGSALRMILYYNEVATDLLLFCTCACAGQMCVFGLMHEFGSLVWICVSVTRKLFTVLLSVIMFNHPISALQWIGLFLVFAGIMIDAGSSLFVDSSKGKSESRESGNSKPSDINTEPDTKLGGSSGSGVARRRSAAGTKAKGKKGTKS